MDNQAIVKAYVEEFNLFPWEANCYFTADENGTIADWCCMIAPQLETIAKVQHVTDSLTHGRFAPVWKFVKKRVQAMLQRFALCEEGYINIMESRARRTHQYLEVFMWSFFARLFNTNVEFEATIQVSVASEMLKTTLDQHCMDDQELRELASNMVRDFILEQH